MDQVPTLSGLVFTARNREYRAVRESFPSRFRIGADNVVLPDAYGYPFPGDFFYLAKNSFHPSSYRVAVIVLEYWRAGADSQHNFDLRNDSRLSHFPGGHIGSLEVFIF